MKYLVAPNHKHFEWVRNPREVEALRRKGWKVCENKSQALALTLQK